MQQILILGINTLQNINITSDIIKIGLLIVILTVLVIAIFSYMKHRRVLDIEHMEGHDFEVFCADLLKQDGFSSIEITKGSGDYGIDILAEKDGVTYAIQCKRYQGPVGIKAVQEAYFGRAYYDRMVGVVMTNQYFTEPAVKAAKKVQILLWDGGYLEELRKGN